MDLSLDYSVRTMDRHTYVLYKLTILSSSSSTGGQQIRRRLSKLYLAYSIAQCPLIRDFNLMAPALLDVSNFFTWISPHHLACVTFSALAVLFFLPKFYSHLPSFRTGADLNSNKKSNSPRLRVALPATRACLP
jgi:hypothetical protein